MTKMKKSGIEKLREAVARDEEKEPNFHDYQGKLNWIIERSKHYEEKTGIPYTEIIDAWEDARSYWYMNYYQDFNQPLLTDDNVHIFDTIEDFKKVASDKGFRCPKCNGISANPYECSCENCDWKSYGLFGTMGKGAFIFVKEKMLGQEIFMPVAFESE